MADAGTIGARHDATGLLASSPLLTSVGRDTLERLLEGARSVRLEPLDWVFRQGDAADRLLLVRSGRLRVVAHLPDASERVVRVVGPGAVLGELALLTGSTRSASAQAIRASELLEVDAERFRSLLAGDVSFAVALATELARQLQVSGGLAPPAARPAVFAVVPLDGEAGVEPLWGELRRALAGLGTLGVADGPPEADAAELVGRLEEEHDRVLLLATADDAWRRFCVRQADRVLLLVGTGGDVRLPAGVDAERAELVLLPDVGAPVARALAAVSARTHHLLEKGNDFPSSVRRLARRVTGRAVGLVLSGGGARGLAHIGAVEALADAGVEVDRVGGCSIGAFIGAMSAVGHGAREMRDVCHRELVRGSPFNDYTVPRVSLIRSRKAARMLERVFAARRLEELPRPMFCVTADLVSSRLVVHREGPVVEAVGASMSIPGLAPPQPRGAGLLVDGGVLNNLPVDLMDAEEGPVVAVDVIRRMDAPGEDGAEAPLPSILETLSRATVLGSVERAEANRALADVVVTPDVQHIGLREFRRLDDAIAAGREAAARVLAEGGADALLNPSA